MYVLVEVPLIPEASLKLDLLECSSLPGIDKCADPGSLALSADIDLE